jgi:hypothetical protein
MHRIALLALAVATAANAQSPFEGAVSMTVTGDNGRSNDVAYMIKGDKVRMEMSGPRGENAAMIYDLTAKTMLIVMAEQKMYMEQPMGGLMAAAQRQQEQHANVKVSRTGRMETIAGYECEHVIVSEDAGDTRDVCIAKGLGAFQMPGMGGRGRGPQQSEAWQSILGGDGFPLKVQKGDKVEMLVTKVEKKDMDAALFAPPAGFTKMDMGMMRGRP